VNWDSAAYEGDHRQERCEPAVAAGAVAEQAHRRVHALKAGVGEALGDGVDDEVAVRVEGQRAFDKRCEITGARRQDPLVKEQVGILVACGLVDAAELLDKEPGAVDVVV
jgi:hypothetical protein